MSGAELSRTSEPTAFDIVVGALTCAICTILAAVAAAVGVGSGHAAGDARAALGFGFRGVRRTPASVVQIALNNGRLAAGVLLAALVASYLPRRGRCLVDLALGAVYWINAQAVGIAFGAYGARLIWALVWHMPLELAALSLAGGAYLTARSRPLRPETLARIAGVCLMLLAVASLLETYLPPRGRP